LRIDYSGLDERGFWPAKRAQYEKDGVRRPGMDFFRKLDDQLPDYVDAALWSAIAGYVRV
jgi:hypothetical protein